MEATALLQKHLLRRRRRARRLSPVLSTCVYWATYMLHPLNSHMISHAPLDNSPRLPHPALPSSGSFGLSASGRLQTHSFNSEQRLRSLPSVTEDLEKQDGLGPEDCCDEMYNDGNRQLAVKRRFLWLARALVWFSALFFPISVLGNYGIFLRRPSVNQLGGDYELGPCGCQKGWVSTK